MTFAEKLAAQMAAKNTPQTQQTAEPIPQPQQPETSQYPQSPAGYTLSETSLPAYYPSLQQSQGSPVTPQEGLGTQYAQQQPHGSPFVPQQWPGTQYAQQHPGSSSFQQQQPQGSPVIPQQRPGTQYAQQQAGSYPYQQQQQPQFSYSEQQHMNVMQQQQSTQAHASDAISMYKQLLQSTIEANHLQAFFPPDDSRLDQAAAVAANNIDQVCVDWDLPKKMGQDLTKLALFDVVIYIDNSGSMAFAPDGHLGRRGQRIEDLRDVLRYVVGIVKLFDSDGLSIRFMNNPRKALDNVKDEDTINQVLAQPGLFDGLTPLGTQLREQIVDDIVGKAWANSLPKPVLVIAITDGIPEGESQNALKNTISLAKEETAKTRYGSGAVSFEFAQVGKDGYARDYLDKLDTDPDVGTSVDCTSSYELESEQMKRTSGLVLTPTEWLLKLLLGAIDSSYDSKDEKRSRQDSQGLRNAPPPYTPPGDYNQQQKGYQAYGSSRS